MGGVFCGCRDGDKDDDETDGQRGIVILCSLFNMVNCDQNLESSLLGH